MVCSRSHLYVVDLILMLQEENIKWCLQYIDTLVATGLTHVVCTCSCK